MKIGAVQMVGMCRVPINVTRLHGADETLKFMETDKGL